MKLITTLFITILLIGCASPEVALQKRYHRKSTVELKLRRQQLLDDVGRGGFDLRFGSPLALAMMGNPREGKIKEKEEIERELLRRYASGDRAAWLPIFD